VDTACMEDADKDGVALVSRMVASGLATAVGMLSPEAAVLAATALPMLDQGFEAIRGRRRHACGYALAVASQEASIPLDEMVRALVNDPAKALLLARTLEAAADAVSEAKVRVLGRGLASGAVTEDEALVMEEVGWAVLLREIEAPHLRILDYLTQQDPETPGHMIVASWADLKRESGFDQLLGPALSMLERYTLVRTVQTLGVDDHMRNRWGITPANASRHFVRGGLTEECLSRFLRAAEPVAPPPVSE